MRQDGHHRILLIEDSDIDAELIAIHLAHAGLSDDLRRARKRADFDREIARGDLDLIIADYSLPDFDGFAALDIAKARAPDVPVVFVSGVGGEDLATEALRRGATDYLVKHNLGRLPAAVARALSETHERAQRRAAEARLVKSEAMMRLALDAAAFGLWQVRSDGRLVLDDRCRQMLGLASGREIGAAELLACVHDDDRTDFERAMHAALSDAGGVLAHECRIAAAPDRLRWVVVRGRRLEGADGEKVRMTGLMQDVTDTRALESRRRHAEVLFRIAAQATGIAIWEIGPGREDIWVDDGYRRIAGLPPDDDGPLSRFIETVVHPDDRRSLAEAFDRALAPGGAEDVELEHRLVRRSDGQVRWIALKGRRVAGIDGLARLIGTVRDVTEERRMQAALRETNEGLERRVAERTRELTNEIAERNRVEETLRQMQRLEAVGQLTSGVAHDFNNLLTVVLSNISLIRRLLAQRGRIDERVGRRLDSMRDAVNRGATLVQQLLAFSRRQRLEPQDVSFNEIVAGMRDLLQTTLGGSVHLQTQLAEELWLARVDPTQMELIILNLVINARDAMQVGGRLEIRTANALRRDPPQRPEDPEPGEYVVLTVRDTGTGMTDDVLARAFEPFFTTKGVGKGSGLGLAQVYGFVKQSAGGVCIETRPGEGTAVHVYMPRSGATRAQGPAAAAPSGDDVQPLPSDCDEIGQSLLLVDDDDLVREATAALLEMHGYRVEQMADGQAALQRLQQGAAYDLVIVDFAMPRMNGADLAAAIRRLRPEQPVLFMTGYADLSALAHVPEWQLLQKPVEEGHLVSQVREMLRAPH